MRRLHYAWLVAGVGLVTLVTAAGFRATTGVLIVPLQQEFGWSRATISVAIAINLVVYGLGGPFGAALAERFGLRRVITVAVLGMATGSGLTLLIDAPWQLDLLWGFVNATATGAISVPLGAMIANRWFAERRGLVTGLLTASNATGQLIFLPLLAWIVGAWGWRYAAGTAAVDHGFGEVAAASLLATIGVFDLIGTLCSGWLTDRYDPRLLLAWYYGLRGISLLALPYAFGSPHFGLILFVIFYGLDWVATVPPTVALTAEHFGSERVGVVFGWIFASHMIGAAVAAWGAGAARTWFGGYGWAFGTSGLLCLFAVGLVAQISRPAPKPVLAPA